MKIRKVTAISEAEQLYTEHIAIDFPPSERPPLRYFMQMIEQSASDIYIYEKDGQYAAYAVFHEEDGYILLNYFAVCKNLRGKGIGSEFLREINSLYTNKKGILLEAEHRDYPTDEADATVRKKRISFYERCGYICLSNFDILLFGIHYHIMLKPLSEDKSCNQDYIYAVLCHMYSGIPTEFTANAIEWVR